MTPDVAVLTLAVGILAVWVFVLSMEVILMRERQ